MLTWAIAFVFIAIVAGSVGMLAVGPAAPILFIIFLDFSSGRSRNTCAAAGADLTERAADYASATQNPSRPLMVTRFMAMRVVQCGQRSANLEQQPAVRA